MPFRMVCPKCDTVAFSIERERRYYSKADPVASLIFSCQCGKRLYGKDVEDEYKRQKKDYENDHHNQGHEKTEQNQLAHVERSRRQQMKVAMAYRAEFEANRKGAGDGEAPATRAGDNAGRTGNQTARPVAHSPHPAILPSTFNAGSVSAEERTVPADGDELCAWHNCTRGPGNGRAVRRKNSKYCSRACSNANARFRFKKRKKSDEE